MVMQTATISQSIHSMSYLNDKNTHSRRPRIGITSRYHMLASPHTVLRRVYIDAVTKAGGMPIVLPILHAIDDFSEWIDGLDALILSGGEDLNPLLFGEEPEYGLGQVDTVRDDWEVPLVRQWLLSGKPLFAICRGIQTLAVAAGGKIIQDIPKHFPNAWRHEQKGLRGDRAHSIQIEAQTTIADLLETSGRIEVNSIHHQTVAEAPDGFRVSARAGDGIIECIESADGSCVFGVQWHPEEMNCPIQDRLFANFTRSVQADIVLRQKKHTATSP